MRKHFDIPSQMLKTFVLDILQCHAETVPYRNVLDWSMDVLNAHIIIRFYPNEYTVFRNTLILKYGKHFLI